MANSPAYGLFGAAYITYLPSKLLSTKSLSRMPHNPGCISDIIIRTCPDICCELPSYYKIDAILLNWWTQGLGIPSHYRIALYVALQHANVE